MTLKCKDKKIRVCDKNSISSDDNHISIDTTLKLFYILNLKKS